MREKGVLTGGRFVVEWGGEEAVNPSMGGEELAGLVSLLILLIVGFAVMICGVLVCLSLFLSPLVDIDAGLDCGVVVSGCTYRHLFMHHR